MSIRRRILLFASIILTPLVLIAAILIAGNFGSANASSHREAPSISKDPYADNTDTYAWIPRGQTENIVLAASWIPFEGPEGGPNYWEWDPDVAYYLYVDNDGDAHAEITYTLSSRVEVADDSTFLYNVGPINSITDATWNRRQYITVTAATADGVTTLVGNQLTAPANIGSKSTPDWPALQQEAVYTYNTSDGDIKIYAGQTDDPFFVDLQVFDLLTLRGQEPPVGYATGNNTPVDSLSGFNVHSLILEVPIAHLTSGDEPVLGVWSTSGRVGGPVLGPDSPDAHQQISRLGMPLVNEVVLPYALKDTFNSIPPSADLSVYSLLQEYVENPLVGRLLCGLYGVPLPEDSDGDCNTEFDTMVPGSGRGDIFQIFATGMVLANPFTIQTASGPVELPAGFNVNQPMNVQPSEMIRINTAISGDLCHPDGPQRLGLLAGDACGFPNGRDPVNDVTDIELAAVAGAAYQVLDGEDADFTFDAGLISVLSDNVDSNDIGFEAEYPYFAIAQSGQSHYHENATDGPVLALSFGNFTVDSSSAPWLQIAVGLMSVGMVGAFEFFRRRRNR